MKCTIPRASAEARADTRIILILEPTYEARREARANSPSSGPFAPCRQPPQPATERTEARIPPRRADCSGGVCHRRRQADRRSITQRPASGQRILQRIGPPSRRKTSASDRRSHRNARLAECTLQLDRAERRAPGCGGTAQAAGFLFRSTARPLRRRPDRRRRWLAGPGQPGHDPALCRSLWRRRNFSDRRNRQSLQLESSARFGGFGLSFTFFADLFSETDPAFACARRSSARNFFAPRNAVAPGLMDSAARDLHRQRRRRAVP